MHLLITGTAGFIGYHLAMHYIKLGVRVTGIDNINDYYDVNLKYARLKESGIERAKITYNNPVKSHKYDNYTFLQINLEDKEHLFNFFETSGVDYVCHLAAQAGVRYSLTNPYAYLDSNITGFMHMIEACRHFQIKHFVYASSSSVYGLNESMPFSTGDNIDHPVSLYAATKKSNELIAHSYSYLYNIPTTGLRFFTVYGPWGRPDMALFIFTKNILAGKPIDVYNFGRMKRDFTYVDDIIEGLQRIILNPPRGNPDWSGKKPDPASSVAPYKVYNIGNSNPVELMDFIKAIEDATGEKAEKNFMPLQPGDVLATFSDVSALEADFGYRPSTPVIDGVKKFVCWYKDYYNI